eukprot:890075_1
MFKCYKCIDLFDSDDSLFTHLEREHYDIVVKMENGVSDDDNTNNLTATIEDMSNPDTDKTGIYACIANSSKDFRPHVVHSTPSSNSHNLGPDIESPGNLRTPDVKT